jgi:hypothetical protein
MAAQLACHATTSRFSYRYQEQRISWNAIQYCSVKWNDNQSNVFVSGQTGAAFMTINQVCLSVALYTALTSNQSYLISIFGNFEIIINSRLIYDGIKPIYPRYVSLLTISDTALTSKFCSCPYFLFLIFVIRFQKSVFPRISTFAFLQLLKCLMISFKNLWAV